MDWCELHLLYSRPQLLLDKIIIINIVQHFDRYTWFNLWQTSNSIHYIYKTIKVWTIIIMDNIIHKIFCLVYDLGI